jgi:hypothetical protein
MYVHEEKKVAFIAHPRTASSATGHTLLQMGFTMRGNHHAFNRKWDLEGWTIGCTVRNPFDTMVSWFYNTPREQPFDLWLPKFIQECHYLKDNHLMFYGKPYATHVLKFENLQNGFNAFCIDADLPVTTIPHRNVSEKRGKEGYMTYYNFARVRLVIERFRDDFVNGNYHIPAVRTP